MRERMGGALAVVASVTWLTGCATPRYFRAPDSCHECYYNSRGGHEPLHVEDDLEASEAARLEMFDGPPPTSWRPIGDAKTHATNSADMIADLKAQAAAMGGDGIIRLAAGEAGTTTHSSSSSSAFSAPIGDVNITGGGTGSSSNTVTNFAGIGTVIRRATPGSEAYLGVSCFMLPAWDQSDEHSPSGLVTVGRSEGPAEKAGLRPGEVLIAWNTDGIEVPHRHCKDLAKLVQRAGVGKEIVLHVWTPSENEAVTTAHENPKFREIAVGTAPEKHRTVRVKLEAIPESWYRGGKPAASAPAAPASAPAPAPASPAGSGCTKDTDCKGDRICVQGACTDPPAPK
jgi:hypothetical protein